MDETEVRDLLREVHEIPGPHPEIPPHVLKRSRRRITTTLVAIVVPVALVAGSLTGVRALLNASPSVPDGVPGGAGTGPSVTGQPEPTVAPDAGGIIGLPLEGATPSAPKHGRLLLYLEGNVGGPGTETAVWVYADGRVIWGDMGGIFPAGAPTEGATGFAEQHLTPSGVDFLQTQVLATGLFEHDLDLLIDRPGFLGMEARNGDRLVHVTWAWDGIVGDAPSASAEQVTALEGIFALLSDPASWPASGWEDRVPTTYVPSRYQVWLRVFPDQGDGPSTSVGERELGLLPGAAASILRNGADVRDATYEVTTDDLRAFARDLDAAGLERWGPSPMGEPVLRYRLDDPYEPGSSLWVFVGPVLPHGEAVFLGPG
jgi:hypothetical protein